ncbi:hypothetical protein J4E90_006844 [Alternaria incomplexa]|uniref:uncharacterized protein n=1 Tax=Alternaria incomplexa TaxID=1187928 RepID=UPI00221FC29E|nr:uncharacterized protein J4E90_006844 [Alternaria incomplexa]KAI4912024.1 hypothetical protein J4E90_006844 [Alternaria incomplexa]
MASEPMLLTSDQFSKRFLEVKSVPKYDATQEQKADHDWWILDKTSVQVTLKEIAELVQSAMKGLPKDDRELEHLLKAITKVQQIEKKPPIKVALLGAQGAGKSLFINALFGIDGLSLTGADGAACTSAIVRYAQYPNNEAGDQIFYAEIKFLNREKMEEMLKEHIKSYTQYYDDADDSDDEEGPRVKSFQQDELDRRLKDTAEDVFLTIFGSREQFKDSWSTSAYEEGEFMSICQAKCSEAMRKYDADSNGVHGVPAGSATELMKKIKPFLTKIKGEPCLWPLVDSVTIRLQHELLQQGLEIIDLPGSGDTNLSRTRHAEEIKATVDVEIVLADTIRITTDDTIIQTTRSGILHHGSSNVKVVATKIDSISDNQLNQCTGLLYDELKRLMQEADNEAAAADEQGDDETVMLMSRYKQYVERRLKLAKIRERAQDISVDLAAKLGGRTDSDRVGVFHISAADYMSWIKSPKIMFKDQPALQPNDTGIPGLRQFLFNLPAQQNLNDVDTHIRAGVPAFVEKVRRVSTQSDRDAGFRTIADEFDKLRGPLLADLVNQAKAVAKKVFKESIVKVRVDVKGYKKEVDSVLVKRWSVIPTQTFKVVLRSRGLVRPGASKSVFLKNGCDWNKHLATTLAPGFRNWCLTYNEQTQPLKKALRDSIDIIYQKAMMEIDDSAANILIIERAKSKLQKIRAKLGLKMKALMEEVEKTAKSSLYWATMEDECSNSLVSCITDGIFDQVFNARPPLHQPKRAGTTTKQKYATPVGKFQKDLLAELMITPGDHFVDRTIEYFEQEVVTNMNRVIDKHFGEISTLMDHFSNTLREQAPIDYPMTAVGEAIRADLKELIPTLEEKALQLQRLLPKIMKSDDETALVPIEKYSDAKDQDIDLQALYTKAVNLEKNSDQNGSTKHKPKRGTETSSKRMKLE